MLAFGPMMRHRIRRFACRIPGACALVALSLTGCATSTPFGQAIESLQSALGFSPPSAITREQTEKLPYASVLASIGDAQPALLVLAKADERERAWVSADHAMLTTKGGRIVKSTGLKSNLHGIRSLMKDPVQSGLHRLAHGYVYTRTYDIMPGYHLGTLVESEFQRLGIEDVTTLGQMRKLLHIEETMRMPALNFAATNDFWIEPETGFVWQSRQHISPFLPTVFTAVTKPFAKDLER